MSFLGSSSTGTSTTATSSAVTGQELLNDITINNPPEDSIEDISFSPQQDLLAVASWDKKFEFMKLILIQEIIWVEQCMNMKLQFSVLDGLLMGRKLYQVVPTIK